MAAAGATASDTDAIGDTLHGEPLLETQDEEERKREIARKGKMEEIEQTHCVNSMSTLIFSVERNPIQIGFGACKLVSSFEKINRIGEGTYGVVYRARDKNTNEIVALKKVRMEHEKNGMPITSLREIYTLQSCFHPNIVKLNQVIVGNTSDSIYLVFEYLEHDLAGLVDTMRNPFTESEIKCLVIQLLTAVAYLHDNWIIHRDIKMSNLLLNNKGELKLADFGLARIYGHPIQAYTPKVVTLWYRAPELLLGTKYYHTGIDIWAVGCILAELLYKAPLMPGKTEIEQIRMIFSLLGTPNEKIWPGYSQLPHVKTVAFIHQPYNNLPSKFRTLSKQGIDILNQFLTYDPEKRITVHRSLSHSYFTEKPIPKHPHMMPTFPTRHNSSSSQHAEHNGRHNRNFSPTKHHHKITLDNTREAHRHKRIGEVFNVSSTTEPNTKRKRD